MHYQDNGSDFAYQDGAYNEYALHSRKWGVTMRWGKEVNEKPYKKIDTFLWAKRQKQEPGKK